MKITFITNLVHHHQVPLADELYKALGADYSYIACEPLPDWLIKGGYDPALDRPYIIRAYKSEEEMSKARRLAYGSDVVIIGSAPDSFIEKRLKENKLTFRYAERYFKNRPWYFPDPRVFINFYKNHFRYRNKNLYLLAASAYTANDVYQMRCYKDKVYKWGYFTRVDDFSLEACDKLCASSEESTPHIMWCARFLRWKHPELPVQLAARLKSKGYQFTLDMYGSGEEFEKIKKLASQLQVNDVVTFCGNQPNEQILQQMRAHDIFLFTSDRNEGWGAVLNESMSNGCAAVASDMIGSAPFLIKDGENGLLFKSECLDSLEEKVCYLLDNPKERIRIAKNAIISMRNEWSPATAAQRFLRLIDCLIHSNDSDYITGPCSKAYPYKTRKKI